MLDPRKSAVFKRLRAPGRTLTAEERAVMEARAKRGWVERVADPATLATRTELHRSLKRDRTNRECLQLADESTPEAMCQYIWAASVSRTCVPGPADVSAFANGRSGKDFAPDKAVKDDGVYATTPAVHRSLVATSMTSVPCLFCCGYEKTCCREHERFPRDGLAQHARYWGHVDVMCRAAGQEDPIGPAR